ncbi:MAG: 2-dehydro-3-deoxygalactonokinase [Acidobacteriota bacterium]
MVDPAAPVLIGLDWGTSSLRAYLIADNGTELDVRARPWGIMHVAQSGFAAAFREVTADWRARWPRIPAIAAGMIGSRHGWREVPYVECPAGVPDLAAGLVAIDADGGPLHLVPGVVVRGPLPNVLRGEETQVVGALDVQPGLANQGLLVLPGTHSKWVTVGAHRIVDFSTYMTGELFAVLRDHSILGRPAAEDGPEEDGTAAGADAFRRGVACARESGAEGVSGRFFTTRSLVLVGDLAARHSLEYLSGLLIGEEVRSALAGRHSAPCPPLVLVGDSSLCARYRDALTSFGVDEVRVCEHAASRGLWRIAAAAGLIDVAAPPRIAHA